LLNDVSWSAFSVGYWDGMPTPGEEEGADTNATKTNSKTSKIVKRES
jgi:hypothetical protein